MVNVAGAVVAVVEVCCNGMDAASRERDAGDTDMICWNHPSNLFVAVTINFRQLVLCQDNKYGAAYSSTAQEHRTHRTVTCIYLLYSVFVLCLLAV